MTTTPRYRATILYPDHHEVVAESVTLAHAWTKLSREREAHESTTPAYVEQPAFTDSVRAMRILGVIDPVADGAVVEQELTARAMHLLSFDPDAVEWGILNPRVQQIALRFAPDSDLTIIYTVQRIA